MSRDFALSMVQTGCRGDSGDLGPTGCVSCCPDCPVWQACCGMRRKLRLWLHGQRRRVGASSQALSDRPVFMAPGGPSDKSSCQHVEEVVRGVRKRVSPQDTTSVPQPCLWPQRLPRDSWRVTAGCSPNPNASCHKPSHFHCDVGALGLPETETSCCSQHSAFLSEVSMHKRIILHC